MRYRETERHDLSAEDLEPPTPRERAATLDALGVPRRIGTLSLSLRERYALAFPAVLSGQHGAGDTSARTDSTNDFPF